jgi:hypothetical protein
MGIFKKLFKTANPRPNVEKLLREKNVPGLIEALNYFSGDADKIQADLDLAGQAAEALGELGDPQALPELRERLQKLSRLEQTTLELPRLAPTLFELDPSQAVRNQKDLAAIRSASQAVRQAIEKLSSSQPAQAAFEAVVNQGQRLIEELSSGQPAQAGLAPSASKSGLALWREPSLPPPFNYRAEIDALFQANPKKWIGAYEVITLEYEYDPAQDLPRKVVGNAWAPLLANQAEVQVFVRNVLCRIDPGISVPGMSGGVYMQYVLDFESGFLEIRYLGQERRVFRFNQAFIDLIRQAASTAAPVIAVNFLYPTPKIESLK